MTAELRTDAEKFASNAENLVAFSGIKLLHVKRVIYELLKLVGGNGIFDSYTRHDITHVDDMLESLSWIIPKDVSDKLQPADWFMIVMSIYFHDVGMLVTRQEFDNREANLEFTEFREKKLYADNEGTDYAAKVSAMEVPDRDRLLYQEFVRTTHGRRIRLWIMGEASTAMTSVSAAAAEVDKVLATLDPQIRQDLAYICESHHEDEVGDVDKFSVSKPYGGKPAETVNLQFAAVVLRTADLLQISRSRTPAVAFRVINPSDPVSLQEWSKQMAVKAVRDKIGRDKDGNVDPKSPRDTVEVHAYFQKVDGFFGLTSYLRYAELQLRQSYEWLAKSRKIYGSTFYLPWRNIDETNIKTEGFLKQSFEFKLDNAKILDLLTGHTLYNDVSVVLRELVQNSLDAIRLQAAIDKHSPVENGGKIEIEWDTTSRILTIRDNGTGMSQRIIEDHFLKVGSSRYHSSEFKRNHPHFASISRFGIGILSAFMIADEVDVVTACCEETEARRLTLRSVHGKYLIQTLDRNKDPDARSLGNHGTVIRLRVRASTKQINIHQHSRRWIVIPACPVTLKIDKRDPVPIGHSSPKDALLATLRESDLPLFEGEEPPGPSDNRKVRVIEKSQDGVTVAFAVEWSDYFHNWTFVSSSRIGPSRPTNRTVPDLKCGVCVEGVRVDPASPGYKSEGVLAIANSVGDTAPRTNVARSGLENTAQRENLVRTIHSQYCSHVADELSTLTRGRSRSLTWAVREARFLLQSLFSSEILPGDLPLLLESARQLPVFIVEKEARRVAISAKDLSEFDTFWTVSGSFYLSAEDLIREVDSDASLNGVIAALNVKSLNLPVDTVLCTVARGSQIDNYALAPWEPGLLRVDRSHRRLDIQWLKRDVSQPRWQFLTYEDLREASPDFFNKSADERLLNTFGSSATAVGLREGLVVSSRRVAVEGAADETAVKVGGLYYLLPDSPLNVLLAEWHKRRDGSRDNSVTLVLIAMYELAFTAMIGAAPPDIWMRPRSTRSLSISERGLSGEEVIRAIEARVGVTPPGDFDAAEFGRLLGRDNIKVFDPSGSRRRDDSFS